MNKEKLLQEIETDWVNGLSNEDIGQKLQSRYSLDDLNNVDIIRYIGWKNLGFKESPSCN
jgi:hypothetical protein